MEELSHNEHPLEEKKQAEVQHWTLHFDGSSRPLKTGERIACYGWVLHSPESIIVKSGYGLLEDPEVSNNIAEYQALIKALEFLFHKSKIKISHLVILGDSMLVVQQVCGNWKCNKPYLYKLKNLISTLLSQICSSWEIKWIPRHENKDADELSKRYYQQNKKSLNSTKKKRKGNYNRRKRKKRR